MKKLGGILIAMVGTIIVLAAIGRLSDPGAALLAQLFGTGEVRSSNTNTVLKSIADRADLKMLEYHIQTVITAEAATGALNSFLIGDRLLLVAGGRVTAGLDLNHVTEQHIEISDDSIIVRVPPVALQDCFLDEQNTYVYDRQSALFANNPNLETEARRGAINIIRDTAIEGGILVEGQEQAEFFLEALLTGLGFENPDIRFDDSIEIQESDTCYPRQAD